MRNRRPKPFRVIRNGRCLFIIHCRSAEQARAVVASRLADTARVHIVAGSLR